MEAAPRTLRIEAFRSERAIVTIQTPRGRYKVFQLFFGRDRSLFVNFPYFRHRTGVLAAAKIPGNGQMTSQVDLKVGGKVASHLVKYSHHPDGRAHFSQTGKVRTEIKRQSIALDSQWGHIFTVQIQGLEGFDKADDSKDVGVSPKRTTITFSISDLPEPYAVKFVGRWFDISKLPLDSDARSPVGPCLNAQDPDGRQQSGVLVASPHENARHVLLLTGERIPLLGPDPEILLFFGGFDAREIMNDTAKEAGFLVFSYAASNADDLKKTLGSVDLDSVSRS